MVPNIPHFWENVTENTKSSIATLASTLLALAISFLRQHCPRPPLPCLWSVVFFYWVRPTHFFFKTYADSFVVSDTAAQDLHSGRIPAPPMLNGCWPMVFFYLVGPRLGSRAPCQQLQFALVQITPNHHQQWCLRRHFFTKCKGILTPP